MITARFGHANFTVADFSGARTGADMRNQSMGLMRAELAGARLDGATGLDSANGYAAP